MGIYELQEREATSMKAMHERAAAHVKTLGGGHDHQAAVLK